jgi:hypothetical protein
VIAALQDLPGIRENALFKAAKALAGGIRLSGMMTGQVILDEGQIPGSQ